VQILISSCIWSRFCRSSAPTARPSDDRKDGNHAAVKRDALCWPPELARHALATWGSRTCRARRFTSIATRPPGWRPCQRERRCSPPTVRCERGRVLEDDADVALVRRQVGGGTCRRSDLSADGGTIAGDHHTSSVLPDPTGRAASGTRPPRDSSDPSSSASPRHRAWWRRGSTIWRRSGGHRSQSGNCSPARDCRGGDNEVTRPRLGTQFQ